MNSSRLLYLLIGAVAGALLSLSGTIVYWVHHERLVHLQVLTVSIADRSHSLVPLLISLEENRERFQAAARIQLISGVAVMDVNVSVLDETQRRMVLPVLESIAAKRSRLKIGKYATPPDAVIEEILVKYDR